ncbi:MAG: hypothetical protein RIR00_2103, partial [Pseudomonadota bacterium]
MSARPAGVIAPACCRGPAHADTAPGRVKLHCGSQEEAPSQRRSGSARREHPQPVAIRIGGE